ncbi:hypothetical protein ZWY2020_038878 [Hordeum vulgare]|nr:hypothetical protein ZWY2020_038878 [Hordeum vulgare]
MATPAAPTAPEGPPPSRSPAIGPAMAAPTTRAPCHQTTSSNRRGRPRPGSEDPSHRRLPDPPPPPQQPSPPAAASSPTTFASRVRRLLPNDLRLPDPPPLHCVPRGGANDHPTQSKAWIRLFCMQARENEEKNLKAKQKEAARIQVAPPVLQSGVTAILKLRQIAVRLSKLEKKGWRPRRTIIVYSWDAEEFVLVPDPDDRSHTFYDYMIRQNPPVEWPVGEQTLQLLSSTLESLHLTSLMDYVSENVFHGA